MRKAGKFAMLVLICTTTNVFAQSNEWEHKIFDWFNTQRQSAGKERVSFDVALYKESERIQDEVADHIIDKKYRYNYTRDIGLFRPAIEGNVRRIVAYKVINTKEEKELIEKNYDFACANIIEELKAYVQTDDILGLSVNVNFNELTYTGVGKRDYLVTYDIMVEMKKPENFTFQLYEGNSTFVNQDQSKAVFGYQLAGLK